MPYQHKTIQKNKMHTVRVKAGALRYKHHFLNNARSAPETDLYSFKAAMYVVIDGKIVMNPWAIPDHRKNVAFMPRDTRFTQELVCNNKQNLPIFMTLRVCHILLSIAMDVIEDMVMRDYVSSMKLLIEV